MTERKDYFEVDDDLMAELRAFIGERFPHFALVVVTEDDELYADWSSIHIAEALFQKGLRQFDEGIEVIWEETEYLDDDEEEGWRDE